ncbi:MAG: acyltransferase domain-containing protein [Arachnia sp.]
MTTPAEVDALEALRGADLALLGFRPDDAAALRALVDDLGNRPALLARVATVREAARARIGDFDAGSAAVASAANPRVEEDGIVALLGLTAVAADVHAELTGRGVPSEIAWTSLADLGQQAYIHRVVHGRFGLSSQTWCAANYTGRLLWLGRLQFTLERDGLGATAGRDTHVLGVHIPEAGPLTPEAIDESLRLAREIAFPAFADHGPRTFVLHSWLLDPGIVSDLHPDSNMARFARRFEPIGSPSPGDRDALFFGFHVEPGEEPVDLDALPQDTSLQRSIVRRLKSGGVSVCSGVLREGDEGGR